MNILSLTIRSASSVKDDTQQDYGQCLRCPIRDIDTLKDIYEEANLLYKLLHIPQTVNSSGWLSLAIHGMSLISLMFHDYGPHEAEYDPVTGLIPQVLSQNKAMDDGHNAIRKV